jgi:periplasmic divalent cation tolerance protein
MSEAAFRIVLTTTGTPESAQRIARALVERRLAACVNIIPAVTSIYHWRGAVESASELLLVIKTEEDQLQQLEVALRELHSYELPEFLVLPVAAGSKSYLEWIHSSLGPEIPDSE